MKATTEHTPLPWPEPEYGNHGNGSFHEWSELVGAKFPNEADAYLAWKAVNCHEGLLEACKAIAKISFHRTFTCASGNPDAECQKCIALSAIAKAEGQP